MDRPPIPIIVSVRNRPIYFWNCLDALHRFTRTPHRTTLVDMASEDPLVAAVTTAFVSRGLLDEVRIMPRNDPALLAAFVFDQLARMSPYFVYVEADAVVLDGGGCWLAEMAELMDADERLAMLGSAIDHRDFVDLARARGLRPNLDEPLLRALIKADSPERLQPATAPDGDRLFRPHNPAGRLMMLRTDALRQVGPGTDGQLDARFRAAGFTTGVSTAVRHRHLSLLHIFDQPTYDYPARDRYMASLDGEP